MASCKKKNNLKESLTHLPYYNCKHIPSVHGRFNNLLGDNLHSKKTLETLHSLYDYDIFNMNSFNTNIDPDFNFLEPRLRSRYFSPHSFAETIKSKINQNHRNFISILHSNIRSLKRNFEQFHQHVLSELKVSFSVIGLTEIRIRDGACNENLPSLPNYYFEYATPPLSAGGVGMFINSQLQYNVFERTSSSSYQALWIEIVDANKKKNICGVVYRKHEKADDFLNYLSSSIELYSSRNRNIYVMGDFNIDLLKFESCSYSKELLELTQSFSLLPAVDKPTRVYGNSATLIDNIFSNNLENSLICGNIVTDTTDHFTQVCIVATHPNPLHYSKQRKKISDYSSFNANRFLSELHEIEWSNSSDNDANKSFTIFYKKINCLVNKHAPMKTLSKRSQNHGLPKVLELQYEKK